MFASVSELKKLAGSFKDTSDDKELELVVDGVNAQIEDYLGRHLTSSTYTDIFDVSENTGNLFKVKGYPLASVTSVSIDGVALTSSEFRVNKNTGTIQISVLIPIGLSMVEVVSIGGMALDEAQLKLNNKAIVYEANLQAYFEYKRKSSIISSKLETGDGGQTEYLEFDLRPPLKKLLNRHRLRGYVY